MPASSTNTLLRSIEFAKKLSFGRRSAIGNFMEPALTSANIVMETMLGPPFVWRWNRAVTGFVCTPGQQDYTLVNWSSSLQVEVGWLTVDILGNSQKATSVTGTTGSVIPAWNPTKGGTTSDGGVTWTNLGTIGVATSQSFSLGWIETVSVQDLYQSTPAWKEITVERCLASDSSQARPRFISDQGDNGQGAITFRLMPVPDQAYPVAITMQQQPVTFTSVNQTWSPIPDAYARIYHWGFLSLMWLFADDPRYPVANQKFVAQLLATAEGLDETQKNIFLQGWQQVTGQPQVSADRTQQGFQARGM